MKATSWGSFPRLFFRFALLGKVENSRLERVWTTFLDPTFFAAWKSPSEWWHETDLVGFVPKGVFSFRPNRETRTNALGTRLNDLRRPDFWRCLGKATPNGVITPTWWKSFPRVFFPFVPMPAVNNFCLERFWPTFVDPTYIPNYESPPKIVAWNRTLGIRSEGCFFRFALMGKLEQTRLERVWTSFVDPTFLRCLYKPTQNGGMKPTSWNSFPRAFFRFVPMWKVENGCYLEKPTQNGTMKPTLCDSFPRVSPRWGNSKMRV